MKEKIVVVKQLDLELERFVLSLYSVISDGRKAYTTKYLGSRDLNCKIEGDIVNHETRLVGLIPRRELIKISNGKDIDD